MNMIQKELIDNKCPSCGESILIKIDDFKIILYDCKNKHRINNILLNEYEKIQYAGYSKMKCDKCKNKNILFNDADLYKCNDCKINLCPACKSNHEITHNIINYEDKKHMCFNHNNYPYISYCKECKLDLCELCLINQNHETHELILYRDFLEEKNRIYDEINILKLNINKFNKEIKNIIEILRNVKKNINVFYKINYNILNKIYENKYLNYEEIQNINRINNFNVIKDIKSIIYQNNINNKFQKILQIYERMNHINELTLIYDLNSVFI